MEHVMRYLADTQAILRALDPHAVRKLVDQLISVRERGGRLFLLGVGGGAAHASHAVNDFRKLAGIEAYTPTDNVAELTARINDDGWETVFARWLQGSHLNARDMVLVFSVGGGDERRNVSVSLVRGLEEARRVGCAIGGVVGRDGGFTAQIADVCVIVPTVNPDTVTAQTESVQAVVWHLLVSHPKVKLAPGKWESLR